MYTKQLVTTDQQVSALAEKISRAPYFGFDTEYSGPNLYKKKLVNVYQAELTGASFAFDDRTSYYLPVSHHTGNAPADAWPRVLNPIREHRGSIWAHGWATAEGKILGFLPRAARDSVLLMWLLGCSSAPGSKKGTYRLKELAPKWLGREMTTYEGVTKGRSFAELTPEEGLDYACDDAEASLDLRDKFYREIPELGLIPAFDLEHRLLPVMIAMENRGMGIDRPRLRALGEELQRRVIDLREQWDFLLPDVLISSPKQVKEWAYEGPVKRWPTVGAELTAKTRELSVNKYNMELAQSHPKTSPLAREAARIRLEWSYLAKNLNTYTFNLIEQANQYPDGRLRCSYKQHGTVTGRLSSSDPNLQNIPVRTEMGMKIKECFIPAPGNVLVAADYSQIELRVLAHLCGSGALYEAYRAGKDVHQITADSVGVSRDGGKTLNFSKIYGAGDKKLGKQLGTTQSEARAFRIAYEKKYPEVVEWAASNVLKAQEFGYIRTLTGLRRDLPDIHSANNGRRWSAERKANNYVVQGTAAGICKLAMLGIHEAMPDLMIAQIHDDIILDVPEKDAQDVAVELQRIMENAFELAVPLVAEAKVGRNGREVK